MVEFQALGALSVTADGSDVPIGGRRQRRLLTLLLIHRNTVVSADRLADVVFEGEPTLGAGTTLRSYIARVRKVVEVDGSASRVETKPPGYKLFVPDDLFDVARFERLVSTAFSHPSPDDRVVAASSLRQALALWRGGAY